MTDKLLLVLEPDNHPLQVIERGKWLATETGAEVTLLWCDHDVSPLGAPFLISNEAEDIGEQIIAASSGSFTNVIGLPMDELEERLASAFDIHPQPLA